MAMCKVISQIKNYIQLHLSDTDNDDYAAMMRELSQWCSDQADMIECGMEEETDNE